MLVRGLTLQPVVLPRISYAATPSGRYIVARGRLWRMSDPQLPPEPGGMGRATDEVCEQHPPL